MNVLWRNEGTGCKEWTSTNELLYYTSDEMDMVFALDLAKTIIDAIDWQFTTEKPVKNLRDFTQKIYNGKVLV